MCRLSIEMTICTCTRSRNHEIPGTKTLLLTGVLTLAACASDTGTEGPGWPGEAWPVSTAEAEGVDPAAIDSLLADIDAGPRVRGERVRRTVPPRRPRVRPHLRIQRLDAARNARNCPVGPPLRNASAPPSNQRTTVSPEPRIPPDRAIHPKWRGPFCRPHKKKVASATIRGPAPLVPVGVIL